MTDKITNIAELKQEIERRLKYFKSMREKNTANRQFYIGHINELHVFKNLIYFFGASIQERLEELKHKTIVVPGEDDITNFEQTILELRSILGVNCKNCGRSDKVTRILFHHITPRELDGEDEQDNRLPLCAACERFIHFRYPNRVLMELKEKVLQEKDIQLFGIFVNSSEYVRHSDVREIENDFEKWKLERRESIIIRCEICETLHGAFLEDGKYIIPAEWKEITVFANPVFFCPFYVEKIKQQLRWRNKNEKGKM